MREIKFRAWDKSKQRISKVLQISIDDDGLLGACLEHGEDCDTVFAKNLEIMQYTGLKDSSNPPKDIYEGDIVDSIWRARNHRKLGVVKFKPIIEGGMNHFAFWELDDSDFSYPSLNMPIEVIGNIYENPELLTDER